MSLQGRIIKIRTEDLQQDRGSFNQEAFDGSSSLYNFCIFLTGNPVGKRAGHIAAQSSGSTPTPFPSMTSCSLLYVPPCRWDSLGHNLDSSHLNNAVVICQTPPSPPPTPYPSLLPACAGGAEWGWCWGVIGPCHGLCIWAHARRHAHSLCGWWRWMPCAFEHSESECVWQTVNQPVMRGNRTVDRSISYFLRRQTEEKHHCSPGKWFAFHSSFISLILLVYLSFCFLPSPPFLPSVCLLQYLSTLNLAVWMFISAHFSSCPSHREGGGDPADQGWVMVYELSPVSDESSTWLDHLYRALQRTNMYLKAIRDTPRLD